jgi:hypothetical protein
VNFRLRPTAVIGNNFLKFGIINMKRIIVMASLFSIFSGLVTSVFAADQYEVAEAYVGLRNMVLTTKPESLGLRPRESDVWGIIMETGYPGAVVSLVTLADGTVSIYFSNGGGIIGLGPHPEPHRIGKELIASAQKFSLQATATKIFPLPKQSYTRFYFLTGNGVVSAEAKEDDLGNQRDALSPLFHKAHELISAIRVVDEQRNAK